VIHETAQIGNPPESRDFEGEPLPPYIHGSARIGPFVTVDAGCIRRTWVGSASFLMAHSHIGHDAIIGSDVEISSGAVIGGGCWIGDGARVGIGATILPRQVIGANARVGAGAVVTKDVPPDTTVVGNPARPIGEKQAPSVVESLVEIINGGCVSPGSLGSF
jgi:acetyltransferase-like isoleucine patch superfamily enzyme